MITIDPKHLATAVPQPGTPMFSDVMARIAADTGLTDVRRRDIQSGLRRVAKALGLPPEQVPADARLLQKRLASFLPASVNLSAKSWSNALSDARAGLARYGVVERRYNRKADLRPAWKRLWEMVLASGDATIPKALGRFVYFLNNMGIEPNAVRFEHAEAFHQWLVRNEVHRDPDHSFRTGVTSWNLAVNRFPEWPRQTFLLPSRAKVIKLRPEAFPVTFAEDLERYLTGGSGEDIFEEDARDEPLRPASIVQYRAMLMRFASILILCGVPAKEIRDLSALVSIPNVRAGVRWMKTQNGNKKTAGLAGTINLLRNLARRHVKVSEADQKYLDHLNMTHAVKQNSGMTQKNRDRLRPLDDEATLRRLLQLPELMFERGVKGGNKHQAALAREDAIAIAILIYCPIRRKNLFSIHLDRNLQRMGDGRVFMVFKEDEVKNAHWIEFELPEHVVAMIDRHLKTRSPRLCPAGTPWLFALRDGSGPANENYFCTKIKARLQKEIGLTINVHLFRHIAAKIWLEDNPGHYEVLKRLLGHSMLSQTINAYAGFEAGTATRLHAAVIDARKRK